MKLTKTSNFTGFNTPIQKSSLTGKQIINTQKAYLSKDEMIENYTKGADTDLINIFNALKGRIRFGAVVDGYRGENMAGEFQIFNATTITASASATSECVVAHGLGSIPVGFIEVNKNFLGNIYMKSATSTNAVFVSSTTGTEYKVFLLE